MNVMSLLNAFKPTPKKPAKRTAPAAKSAPAPKTATPQPEKPPTKARIQKLYQRPKSFTDLLPWMEFVAKDQVFVLEDGVSVAAMLNLWPVGTEGRPYEGLLEISYQLRSALTDAFSEEDHSPWVVQFFLQDDASFRDFVDVFADYPGERAQESQFTNEYMDMYREHLRQISVEGGLFVDEAVSGAPWQGKIRRTRCIVYRRLTQTALGKLKQLETTPAANLNDTIAKFTNAIQSSGVYVQRAGGREFYDWMVRWFNPAPEMAEGDREKLLDIAPYPGDEEMPYGADFAESMLFSMPRSDNKSGTWWFDNLPHRIITIQGMRRIPLAGHITAERAIGDRLCALHDLFPEHTTVALTVVIRPQDQVTNHLALVKKGAVGDSAEALITRHDCDIAAMQIAQGNKLYPVTMGCYVRGKDLADLRKNTNYVNSLLISNGFQPITQEADLLALDSYMRNLPMCYDVQMDKSTRRSRLMFSNHIANLLPVYGRSRGTGHPGMVFFNRGAEPLVFDPLNKYDRKKNAHMLIIGPTGAGKSAMMVYLMMQMMAVYRPRLFVIEAGNSFGLMGQYFAEQGVTVNQVSLQPGSEVSLPPFADALQLLHKKEDIEIGTEDLLAVTEVENEEEIDENRDLLGEMEIAARIMITGGDVREDARMTRADRMLIRKSIYAAAQKAEERGADQVLTQDVVNALHDMSLDQTLPDRKRERAGEMADGMELFCSGLAGKFFNSPGQHWPDVDVTIMDMGILAREGYEDQLTVAYISLINHINNLVERYQHHDRPTIVLTDEGHIITTNPLLAPYVIKITKMWRKLGTWFWIATQNLADFPDASKRMLNMLEWWLCLVMPKEEVEQIARFKDLTEEQKYMLLSARKEPGKFVEGVVLADQIQALFRSVPPALCLALAMTEKHEKAERGEIMRENNCSEIDAVRIVTQRIMENRSR